jgi:predicted exporter
LATVYRNFLQLGLVFVPAASGILAAVVMVSWYYGTVHGITLAFAITLLGEAIDYPSYLFLQTAPGATLATAARDIWPTLRLAVLTTVFGSLAMLFSSIQGLSQLGMLGAVGIAVAGLVNRWVVPPLSPMVRPVLSPAWKRPDWLRALLRPRPWLVAALMLMAIVFLAAGNFTWEDDIGALNPLPASTRLRDQQLRGELGAPDVRFIVVYPATNIELALAGSEALRPALDALVRDGLLRDYEMAADFLPSLAVQSARQAALPSPQQLQPAVDSAARATGFRPQALAPFIGEVAKARQLPPVTLDDINDRAWKLRADSLLLRNGDGVAALILLKGIADGDALSSRADTLAPAMLIDLKQETGSLVAAYRRQILAYSGCGLLLISVLLLFHLRHPVLVLRVQVPPLLAVVCTLAILTAAGERITLFHLVALLLVLGIGINYALFFNRRPADHAGSDRVVLSLLVCCTSTLIGFGTLAISSIAVLHGIGLTAFCGALLSFVFSAWLSPPQTAPIR